MTKNEAAIDAIKYAQKTLTLHNESDIAINLNRVLDVLMQDMEAAIDTIGYLLPLAKGYVAAHPGIKSTEAIIEDAEAMIKGFRDE